MTDGYKVTFDLFSWLKPAALLERKETQHRIPRVFKKKGKSLCYWLFLKVPGELVLELVKKDARLQVSALPSHKGTIVSASPPAPGPALLVSVLKRSSGCHIHSFWCQVCAVSLCRRQVVA